MPYVLVALASLLLLELGAVGLLLAGADADLPGALVAELLRPRATGLVAAGVLLLLHRMVSRRLGRALANVVSLAAFTGLVWWLAPLGRPLPVALALGVALVPAAADWRWPAARRRRALLAAAAALAAAGVCALVPARWERTWVNAAGLVGSQPNERMVVDDSRNPVKDGYPVCTHVTNSYGYRDPEPPQGPRTGPRLLLVGDSYVWGDGIPQNEQSLPARTRAELERREPGRWLVFGAGYPGNNLYGYARAARRLAEDWRIDVVVLSYLGRNDDYPLDPQFLVDHLPRSAPLRNALTNLDALPRLAMPPRMLLPELHDAAHHRFAELAAALRARGTRLLVLVFEDPGFERFPEGVDVLSVPPELRYPGHATDLWYARDYHPKPELIPRLAALLAPAAMALAPTAASSSAPVP